MRLENTIAFFGAETTTNDEIRALSGICAEANKNGWKVLIFNALKNHFQNDQMEIDSSIFKLADIENFSGVIIGQNVMEPLPETAKEIINKCKANGIPVMSMGVKTSDCYSCYFSNTNCLEKMVDHLIEKHGCKTLNLMAGIKNNSFSEQRVEAFKNSLKKHHIQFDENRLSYGSFWEGATRDEMKKFFESGLPIPDAFVCCNDVMAMTVCDELKKKGYSVPEDILVTGYDGIEEEKFHSPRLSTVRCNYYKLGELGFSFLKDIISGTVKEKSLVMEPDLVFTESCGCKNVNNESTSNYAFEAMGTFGEIRYTTTLLHNFAIQASQISSVKDLPKAFPYKGHFGGEMWVMTNKDYLDIQKKISYTKDNPFSNEMETFLNTRDHMGLNHETIFKEDYIPFINEVFNSGIKNLVFMNLFFGKESIGYIAVPYWGLNTLVQLMNAERFTQSLGQNISLVRNRQELEFLNYHDMMTGIYNRRGFYHFFAENIEKRINTKCSLIIHSIDMDGLKTINDTYGHKEGDYAISVLAQGLIKSGNETVIAARFGGDEFVTVEFTENGQEPDINSFRKNLQEYLNTVNVHSGKPYKISCSVGSHSTLFPPNMNVDQIIAEADKLMYDEKSKKKRSEPRL